MGVDCPGAKRLVHFALKLKELVCVAQSFGW